MIDATPNGLSANSYLTLTEADDLSLGILSGEKWDDLDDEDQERILLTGTRLIDRYPEGGWGPREKEDQRLVFPRVFDEAGVIPEGVKIALMEFVDYRLAGDLTALKAVQGEGVKSMGMLGQSSSFDSDTSGLPAGARMELDRLLEASVPTLTRNREDEDADLSKDFFP